MENNNTPVPFCNAHSHIFTVSDAPDYFLKTGIHNDGLARLVERLLQKGGTRALLKGLHWMIKLVSPNYRNSIERYIEFIEIGTSAQQKDIFNMEAQAYVRMGAYRIVVLTQVLDYLDYGEVSHHKRIQTQVQEVVDLKRDKLYQDRLFPFLGLDPRMQGVNLLQWVQQYISQDYGFYGIKIYPAYGFFPFDIRLDPVWAWAEKNNVPVMTHATRGGSFYLGSFDSILSSGGFHPVSLNDHSPHMGAILERINALVQDNSKSLKSNNKVWCNIFGHPENYLPVLEKYPNLKICLAHLGGSDEVNRSYVPAGKKPNPPADYPEYMGPNWYPLITDMMDKYANVYSDISYTLSDPTAMPIIVDYFRGGGAPLIKKLMYGTDFYLTQAEAIGDEPDLIKQFLKLFSPDEVQLLAYQNPDAYLKSAIHP